MPEGVAVDSCKPKCVPADCPTEAPKGGDPAAASCNEVGDPVDLTSLFLKQTVTDVDLGGGLRFTRHYSSGWLETSTPGPLGHKWDHALHWRAQRRITPQGHRILIVRHPLVLPQVFVAGGTAPLQANATSGSLDGITTDNPVYISGEGVRVGFELDPNPPAGQTWFRATSIQHPGEPAISVSYPPTGNQVVLSNGTTSMEFLLADGRIDHVVTPIGTWDYDYDEDDRLETVTGPDLSTSDAQDEVILTYEYQVGGAPYHLLTKVKRKVGSAPEETLATWTYFPTSRWVKTADDPTLDQPLTFTLSGTSPITTQVKDPSGTVLATFVSKEGRLQSVTGEGGPGVEVPFASATYVETPNPPNGDPIQTNWKTTTDPEGNKTLYEDYDSRSHAGRVVEGWLDNDQSGSWTAGDGKARIVERTWHPRLDAPLSELRESTLTGQMSALTVFDYDAPPPIGTLDTSPANEDETDLLGRIIRTGYTLSDAGSNELVTTETTFYYNAAGKLEAVTGPRPENCTRHGYDAQGRRTHTYRYLNGCVGITTCPSGSCLATSFGDFDDRGNPETVTDPNGAVTEYTYDAEDRIKTVKPPYAAADSTVTFDYDVDGRLKKVSFPTETSQVYYFLELEYDVKGRVEFIKDSNGDALVYAPYEKGLPTREARYRNFQDLDEEFVSDARFSPDSVGRLFAASNPLFPAYPDQAAVYTEFGYDLNGNVNRVQDENADKALDDRYDTLIYDALDRLTTLQQVRGQTTFDTVLGYDALSNISLVTDPADLTTLYHSDDFGRLVKLESPDTGTTLFRYDLAGNLVKRIENFTGTQRTTHYEYDGLDRLTRVDLPNDPDWVFTWDADSGNQHPDPNLNGRLARVSNGIVTTIFAYTDRGEVAVERTSLDGIRDVIYEWDVAGNLSSITTPAGTDITYTYGGARPVKIDVAAGQQQQTIRNVKWLPFGPRTHADFPPFDTGTGENVVTSERGYNARGQLNDITVTVPTGQGLDREYLYHSTSNPVDLGPNLDRITDNLDSSQSRVYRYDELDRLAVVEDGAAGTLEEFDYTPGGNRTSWTDSAGTTTYTYEENAQSQDLNRLDSATGARARDYANDVFGNRIYEGTAPYDQVATHIYTDENRLREVKDPANGFATLGTYVYDAFGRRVRKTAGGVTTYFVYDLAGHVLSERTPGSPTTVRDYVWLEDELVGLVDANVGQSCAGVPAFMPRDLLQSAWWVTGSAAFILVLLTPALRRRPRWAATVVGLAAMGGSVSPAGSAVNNVRLSWIHVDHLGTPLAVTNTPTSPSPASSATTIWRATHAAYGKALVDEDPDGNDVDFTLRVRFSGQYEDGETGLHYNLYRSYDPNTGRYLEQDPFQPSSPARETRLDPAVVLRESVDYVLPALMPYDPEFAGRIDPITGRMSDLGLPPGASARTSGYIYAGSDPIGWVDPGGDSKTEGIKRGADEYLTRLRAAQGNNRLVCEIEEEAERRWKAGEITSKKRYRNIKAWAKMAKRGDLVSLVPAACLLSTCVCAEQPEICVAMFEQ
jgi:RHS repeat-associated protein